jgi:predicted GIY-YIG superfamily endonuclease
MPRSGERIRGHQGRLVYLLHYSAPTAAGRQHYLGCTSDLTLRLKQHRAGRCAETAKAVEQGLKVQLAQTWSGSYSLERELKTWFRSTRTSFGVLCPYCAREGDLPPKFEWLLHCGTYRVSWSVHDRAA